MCVALDRGAGTVAIGGTRGRGVYLLTEDTFLSSACDYVLTDETYVGDATLSIEAGTTIRGATDRAVLVITNTGTIRAIGTADSPIVFTSQKGEDAQPGDWGGVVLLGRARLSSGDGWCNGVSGGCVSRMEGLGAEFGGSDDRHDCGTLNYVRIGFAGSALGGDNELSGLSVGGCGSDTELDFI